MELPKLTPLQIDDTALRWLFEILDRAVVSIALDRVDLGEDSDSQNSVARLRLTAARKTDGAKLTTMALLRDASMVHPEIVGPLALREVLHEMHRALGS